LSTILRHLGSEACILMPPLFDRPENEEGRHAVPAFFTRHIIGVFI
jgi:hypothetical protein